MYNITDKLHSIMTNALKNRFQIMAVLFFMAITCTVIQVDAVLLQNAGSIEMSLNPNSSKEFFWTIHNTGTNNETIKLDVENGLDLFSYPSSVTISPNSTKEIPFTVTIPINHKPQNITSLITATSDASNNSSIAFQLAKNITIKITDAKSPLVQMRLQYLGK